jgi:hypothetical protein
VVRKWSYINNRKRSNLIGTTLTKNNFFNNFKFKIFRKNTRFKNYVVSKNTRFIRTYIISKKRQSTLKLLVVLSSQWVKPSYLYKNFLSFIQSKQMFLNSVPFLYKNNFLKNINTKKFIIGFGSNTIFFTKIHQNLNSKFSSLPNNTIKSNTNSVFQSSSIETLLKLYNLNFFVPLLKYDNSTYPLQHNHFHTNISFYTTMHLYNLT